MFVVVTTEFPPFGGWEYVVGVTAAPAFDDLAGCTVQYQQEVAGVFLAVGRDDEGAAVEERQFDFPIPSQADLGLLAQAGVDGESPPVAVVSVEVLQQVSSANSRGLVGSLSVSGSCLRSGGASG